MRWLFVAMLAILVACVLSIIWMNDVNELPAGGGGIEPVPPQPRNPLVPDAPSAS